MSRSCPQFTFVVLKMIMRSFRLTEERLYAIFGAAIAAEEHFCLVEHIMVKVERQCINVSPEDIPPTSELLIPLRPELVGEVKSSIHEN